MKLEGGEEADGNTKMMSIYFRSCTVDHHGVPAALASASAGLMILSDTYVRTKSRLKNTCETF